MADGLKMPLLLTQSVYPLQSFTPSPASLITAHYDICVQQCLPEKQLPVSHGKTAYLILKLTFKSDNPCFHESPVNSVPKNLRHAGTLADGSKDM
ncbi:MAG: hypothetical protein F8N36_07525 [Desulfovibrio sp.]|uniref:hypothetical protein n=1 Tax=Desulfovibrio sp. TaxID=885 RepID=UPI00135E1754|nr:hypothetical protein [Desulfovibrio sp.]MTJ92698.1 hypothetical protein [Desulfovibrio sp.]